MAETRTAVHRAFAHFGETFPVRDGYLRLPIGDATFGGDERRSTGSRVPLPLNS
jgi:hypothetical protein